MEADTWYTPFADLTTSVVVIVPLCCILKYTVLCFQSSSSNSWSSFRNSSVVAPPGQVLTVQNGPRYFGDSQQYFDYGPNGDAEKLLTAIYRDYGPVSSFTGTYQADVWRLNINRKNPDSSKLSKESSFLCTFTNSLPPLPLPLLSLQIACQLHFNSLVSSAIISASVCVLVALVTVTMCSLIFSYGQLH